MIASGWMVFSDLTFSRVYKNLSFFKGEIWNPSATLEIIEIHQDRLYV